MESSVIQLPPFRHGLLTHGEGICTLHCVPVNPGLHVEQVGATKFPVQVPWRKNLEFCMKFQNYIY